MLIRMNKQDEIAFLKRRIDAMSAEYCDADDTIFFAQELQTIRSQTYDIKYPEFKQRNLIPVDGSANNGANSIAYDQYDATGKAKIISDWSADWPNVDAKGKRFSKLVQSYGDSYQYNIQEVRAARMAGKGLEMMRADAAKRAIAKSEQDDVYFGNAAAGLTGLFSDVNIPSGTVPADGVALATEWTAKTPDLIVRDIMLALKAPFNATKGVEMADTLLMPDDHYNLIATTRMGNGSDTTILSFVKSVWKARIGRELMIEPLWQLDAANNDLFVVDVMMAYHRNPRILVMDVPQDFEQFAPATTDGVVWKVKCHERFAGVTWFYPKAAQIYDSI